MHESSLQKKKAMFSYVLFAIDFRKKTKTPLMFVHDVSYIKFLFIKFAIISNYIFKDSL